MYWKEAFGLAVLDTSASLTLRIVLELMRVGDGGRPFGLQERPRLSVDHEPGAPESPVGVACLRARLVAGQAKAVDAVVVADAVLLAGGLLVPVGTRDRALGVETDE